MPTSPITALLQRPRARDPERALMAAVLADAVELILDPPPVPPRATDRYDWVRVQRETAQWFLSDSLRHPFSFVSICDVLDLEPGPIRRALNDERPLAAVARTTPGRCPRGV